MTNAPCEVGDRIDQNELKSRAYIGLSGNPGSYKHAVQSFTKGMWVLEVHADVRRDTPPRFASIRSSDADEVFWSETRDRLMRHKRQQ